VRERAPWLPYTLIAPMVANAGPFKPTLKCPTLNFSPQPPPPPFNSMHPQPIFQCLKFKGRQKELIPL